jgi:hypothetical protein
MIRFIDSFVSIITEAKRVLKGSIMLDGRRICFFFLLFCFWV